MKAGKDVMGRLIVLHAGEAAFAKRAAVTDIFIQVQQVQSRALIVITTTMGVVVYAMEKELFTE